MTNPLAGLICLHERRSISAWRQRHGEVGCLVRKIRIVSKSNVTAKGLKKSWPTMPARWKPNVFSPGKHVATIRASAMQLLANFIFVSVIGCRATPGLYQRSGTGSFWREQDSDRGARPLLPHRALRLKPRA